MKEKCIAVILAAGQGKRMGGTVQKQYLDLCGKPILYYTLRAFERSAVIDEIILVTGKGDTEWVQSSIVEAYGFEKVSRIVEGGKERYDSVWNALRVIEQEEKDENLFLFIHDGARPFVEEEVLQRALREVEKSHACVVAVPVKDTIKFVNEKLEAQETPDRKRMWMIQTPQVFSAALIIEAYRKMMDVEHSHVTDDAMAVEMMTRHSVKMVEGSYRNIKITTPEDLCLAKAFLADEK